MGCGSSSNTVKSVLRLDLLPTDIQYKIGNLLLLLIGFDKLYDYRNYSIITNLPNETFIDKKPYITKDVVKEYLYYDYDSYENVYGDKYISTFYFDKFYISISTLFRSEIEIFSRHDKLDNQKDENTDSKIPNHKCGSAMLKWSNYERVKISNNEKIFALYYEIIKENQFKPIIKIFPIIGGKYLCKIISPERIKSIMFSKNDKCLSICSISDNYYYYVFKNNIIQYLCSPCKINWRQSLYINYLFQNDDLSKKAVKHEYLKLPNDVKDYIRSHYETPSLCWFDDF